MNERLDRARDRLSGQTESGVPPPSPEVYEIMEALHAERQRIDREDAEALENPDVHFRDSEARPEPPRPPEPDSEDLRNLEILLSMVLPAGDDAIEHEREEQLNEGRNA